MATIESVIVATASLRAPIKYPTMPSTTPMAHADTFEAEAAPPTNASRIPPAAKSRPRTHKTNPRKDLIDLTRLTSSPGSLGLSLEELFSLN